MSFTLLHGSDDAIHCELYDGVLNVEIIDDLVKLGPNLYSYAPDHDYFNRINDHEFSLTLIARDKAGDIIGFKIG